MQWCAARSAAVSGEGQVLHVVLVLHEHHRSGYLPHRPFDFRMAGVADQDDDATLRDVALALTMHLGDQRARRIEHAQSARARVVLHHPGHAVRAEHGDRPGGHLRQMLDEPRTFGAQALDDVAVVHDLVAHVDRRAEPLERVLDDIDRTNHTRAKSARLREHHMHERYLARKKDRYIHRPLPRK